MPNESRMFVVAHLRIHTSHRKRLSYLSSRRVTSLFIALCRRQLRIAFQVDFVISILHHSTSFIIRRFRV